MPNKKDFPSWFSQYSQPYCPSIPKKPSKTIVMEDDKKVIRRIDRWNSPYKINDNLYIGFVETFDDESPSVEIYELKTSEIENPSYEKELKYYQKQLKDYEEQSKEYKEKKKEWKTLKKKWDLARQEEIKQHELRQLERLKKKYEKQNVD